MMRSKLVLFGAMSALLLGACTPSTQEAAEDAMMEAEQTVEQTGDAMMEAEDTLVADDDAMMEGEMTLDSFSFGYSEMALEMSPGETKTITLTNSSEMPHDFVIDELDVASEQINGGETDTFTITIPEDATPGTTYAYYCSVGQHRAQGMEGVLTVK